MYASILNITFDCADAKAQATFWAAVPSAARSRRFASALAPPK